MNVDYLIVGGGGGGGGGDANGIRGGGGGGGDVVAGSIGIGPGTHVVTVGGGGAHQGNGGTSGVFGLNAAGGGYGGDDGQIGGYGANGGGSGSGYWQSGGSGTYPRGNGGPGANFGGYSGGGGGASTQHGGAANTQSQTGGAGATGTWSNISGAAAYYGSGAGGAGGATNGVSGWGAGSPGNPPTAGANGYGGGGGPQSWRGPGANGGHGIVIIRYAGVQSCTGGTVTSSGGYTIHTFYSNGGFTVPNPPVLDSIAPAQGYRGEDVYINFYGSGFVVNGSTIVLSTNGGMSLVSGTVYGDTTHIAVYARLTQAALLGVNHALRVDTVGGQSAWAYFNAVQRPPTLSSLSINASGLVGQYPVYVGINGTQLTPDGFTINVDGGGVSVGAGPWNGGWTYWEVYLAIAANAAHGPRNLTVTTVGGTSNALTFWVYGVPTITNLDNTVVPGNTFRRGNVNIYTHIWGAALTNPTTGTVSGTGVTCTFAAFGGEGIIALHISVAADAPLGARTITVTTPGGTSNTWPITILPLAPVISAINATTSFTAPAQSFLGVKTRVRITGADFHSPTVTVSGGITVSSVAVQSTGAIDADFTGTAVGTHTVYVTTTGGTASFSFTVLALTTLGSAAQLTNHVLGSLANAHTGTLGYHFTVGAKDRRVTALGRYRHGSSVGKHKVALLDGNYQEIASAVVDLSTVTPDTYGYTSIIPSVVVRANAPLMVVSFEINGGATYANNSVVTGDGMASIDGIMIQAGGVQTVTTFGSTRTDGPYMLGFKFTSIYAYTLMGLGRYKRPGDAQAHTVILRDANGTILRQGVVDFTGGKGLDNQFSYVMVAPIGLSAGGAYFVETSEAPGGDPWVGGGGDAGVTPYGGITIQGSTYSSYPPVNVLPNGPSGVNTSYSLPTILLWTAGWSNYSEAYGVPNLRWVDPGQQMVTVI